MMLWRERISAARSRGRFTQGDVSDAFSPDRCAVGELTHQGLTAEETYQFYSAFGGSGLGSEFAAVIFAGSIFGGAYVDRAEALLDQIEDQALQIKRGRTA